MVGSDESYFNVSVGSDGQSHKTVSTNHNLFEEKGEPKRDRTEVLPLTSLTPYRWAKLAHPHQHDSFSLYIAASHMAPVIVYYTLLVVIIICIIVVKL